MFFMRKFLALLVVAFLCFATKVYAEDVATVTVTVANFPQKLQNRTVIVTLGKWSNEQHQKTKNDHYKHHSKR